ncbi:hypothetical protein C4L14_18205 [Enterobacter sp. RC4]|nr:hypothetical protein C4L14_18205 [Enterobacter sp. RC4]
MKDQITHLPDNADRSVAKQKFKITNWPTYNKALITLLHGDVLMWLMKTLLTSGCTNQRGAGQNMAAPIESDNGIGSPVGE